MMQRFTYYDGLLKYLPPVARPPSTIAVLGRSSIDPNVFSEEPNAYRVAVTEHHALNGREYDIPTGLLGPAHPFIVQRDVRVLIYSVKALDEKGSAPILRLLQQAVLVDQIVPLTPKEKLWLGRAHKPMGKWRNAWRNRTGTGLFSEGIGLYAFGTKMDTGAKRLGYVVRRSSKSSRWEAKLEADRGAKRVIGVFARRGDAKRAVESALWRNGARLVERTIKVFSPGRFDDLVRGAHMPWIADLCAEHNASILETAP